ncbi:MAG: CxxxxCH/CxxCH domain-containing protein [Nitrospiraceae bacterium]|nr:MAG: CxxxxCH/CxxCH domain-containing protein [Nitrospiraceae bacterium]
MKKYLNIIALVSTLTLGLITSGGQALDYPHFSGNSIGCSSCHFVYGSQPSLLPPWTAHLPQDIDDTQYNTLCWSCHNDIEAPYVRTHSSLQTDNGYGDWTIECRTCHNPHTQRQADTYGSSSYLYSGTSTNITSTVLTKSGAGWGVNAYQGLVVIPNTAQMKYKYRISGNTADTLMISGPVDLTKAAAGNTFAIVYGKLIESTIRTPSSGNRTARFFNNTGPKSFADGDGTYDGICEVCHTQTVYHRNNASGNHTHNEGLKCTLCHTHADGFKGTGCDVCHGYPPVVSEATGGPHGLVNNPGVTGSAAAGAHNKHVNDKFYPCDYCHYRSVGSGARHNDGPPQDITMGFSLFGGFYNGGIYDGQAAAGYDSSEANTTVIDPAAGSKTCSNIYCHGELPDGSKWGNGINTTPVWDGVVSCGDCHLATNANPPVLGSHKKHTGGTAPDLDLTCTLCHSGYADRHADSQVHVAFAADSRVSGGSYSGTAAMFDSYGQCSNISCHSNVQNNTGTGGPTSYANPVWGSGALACNSCHGYPPNTGTHLKHMNSDHHAESWLPMTCNTCHYGSTHANGSIEVASNSGWVTNFSYTSSGAPGNGYGFCAGACHSGAVWNGPAIYCIDCHGVGPGYPEPAAQTAPVIIPEPDVTSTTDMSVVLQWYPAPSVTGPPSFTEYYVEVDDDPAYTSPNYNSGWIASTGWTVIVETAATWHWRVKARDAVRTLSQFSSAWVMDSFAVISPGSPPAVSLIPEPDYNSGGGPVNITLQWSAVTDPEGDPVQYNVQVSYQSNFTSTVFTSGWISGTSYTFSTSCTGMYWRVRARDAISGAVSPWSSVDFFWDIFDCYGEW